jgi:hypothetical protein
MQSIYCCALFRSRFLNAKGEGLARGDGLQALQQQVFAMPRWEQTNATFAPNDKRGSTRPPPVPIPSHGSSTIDALTAGG